MASNKPITIRQVAHAAGVSTQTVSRVVNERPDVAPETRQRVQEVIDRLGYRPNALARSLINRRSHTIGVVAMARDYFGPSHTLIGIEQQIRSTGYSLLLDLLHHPETEDVERILNRLLTRQVDGIIWAIPEIGYNRSWLQHRIVYLPVPTIFLSMGPQEDVPVVAIDNRGGGRLAAGHLLALGYQNIGTVIGPQDWWEARQRQLGWKDALQAAGMIISDRQIAEGDWSSASGAQAFKKLLRQFPEIDAVFAGNDQMALGILQAAHQFGRRVPADLAVVGFDNIPESAYFWPALTTVQQPLIELGCTAVKELARLIDAEQNGSLLLPSGTTWLQTDLVVRESSGFSAKKSKCSNLERQLHE